MFCWGISTVIKGIFILLALMAINAQAFELDHNKFREILVESFVSSMDMKGNRILLHGTHKDFMTIAKNRPKSKVLLYSKGGKDNEYVECNNIDKVNVAQKDEGGSYQRDEVALIVAICPSANEIGSAVLQKIEASVEGVEYLKEKLGAEQGVAGLDVLSTTLEDGTRRTYYPTIIVGHGLFIIRSILYRPPNRNYTLLLRYISKDSSELNNPIFPILESSADAMSLEVIKKIDVSRKKT